MTRTDRYRGCLFGLALGDAVGTTCDAAEPGAFRPIDDMLGGGPHRLLPGHWSGETSMALCLADSLVKSRVFDARDQMERYAAWAEEGYLSSTGQPFDIDPDVGEALARYRETGNPWQGPEHPESASAACLSRLAPVVMFYAGDPDTAIAAAAESVRLTHGAPQAIDAARYFTGILLGALRGVDKEDLLRDHYSRLPEYWLDNPLHPEVDEVAKGSFLELNPPDIVAENYAVSALEAALWAFATTRDFRDGALAAANLGLAASAVGAIYGQLAGAYYSLPYLPHTWWQHVAKPETIENLAWSLLIGSGTG